MKCEASIVLASDSDVLSEEINGHELYLDVTVKRIQVLCSAATNLHVLLGGPAGYRERFFRKY